MARREPDRAWILAEVAQPQRLAVADQHAEDAAAARQVADRRLRLVVDADGDELLEPGPEPVDHAERAVARAGQLDRRLDQALQQRLERELGAERDPDLDQTPQAIGRVRPAEVSVCRASPLVIP